MTESKKLKYSYTFGLGAFLMTGCYQFTGMPELNSVTQSSNKIQPIQNNDDYDSGRKKRSTSQNQTDDIRTFCNRYAVPQKSLECKVKNNKK